jgi:thiosulfate dehydrogenase
MKRGVTVLVSFAAGLLVLPVFAYFYIAYGRPPVGTADNPFPLEAEIVKIPLKARINREMPATVPIPVDDAALTAGAQVYQTQCAFCHGKQNAPAAIATTMFPKTPQLWAKHKNGVVGVSDDPASETYWKVKNGIRLTGMPAYGSILSDTQIWQVSLLLSKADQPLPSGATRLLSP